MTLLLALLVLLVSASIAVMLAWAGTHTRRALLVLSTLVLASGGVLVSVISYDDELPIAAVGETLASLDQALTYHASPSSASTATPLADVAPTVTLESEAFVPFVTEPVTDAAAFAMPTAFAIGDEGELYVGHSFGISVLRDTTGDGFYDNREHFGLEAGWIFGLDYYHGALYAAVAGSVLRLSDRDGDGVADDIFTLAEGLPSNLYGGHSNSGLAVGPDGLLYMTVGGTSDHGPELEPLGGTILRMELGGGEPEIYASGFRNPYDLAFCPDGRLYATDNGPDQQNEVPANIPWDEVNLIEAGGRYGYPDYFGPVPSETGTISPAARVAPSAGITGITCYSGEAYPMEYEGRLFVTLWGTFTYPVETGRRVMRIDTEETADGPRGVAVEFASGVGRPIDILQDHGGHLLVLDYENGQIFRISYAGS